MENNEVLQQILGKLTSMDNRLDKLEQGQQNLEQNQVKMGQDLQRLEQGQQILEQGQHKLEHSLQKLEQGQANLQVAITETHNDVKELKQDHKDTNQKLADLDKITMQNLKDIALLKAQGNAS
nr:hypothetical protein [Evansella caseinilytica]